LTPPEELLKKLVDNGIFWPRINAGYLGGRYYFRLSLDGIDGQELSIGFATWADLENWILDYRKNDVLFRKFGKLT